MSTYTKMGRGDFVREGFCPTLAEFFPIRTWHKVPFKMTSSPFLPHNSACLNMRHDKANKVTYAKREDSDQPVHPPNVIRVFDVHLNGILVLLLLLCCCFTSTVNI